MVEEENLPKWRAVRFESHETPCSSFGSQKELRRNDVKILITGSSGQIGSHLLEELQDKHEVIGLDLVRPADRVRIENATLVSGDIRNLEMVTKIVKKVDAIIHTAAQISVQDSIKNPVVDAKTNIMGTVNLLAAASQCKTKRFVYFSSAAVFGEPAHIPINEEHPTRPLSPYGLSKLAGESYCVLFHKVYGLPTVCIRPFNVYSRRMVPGNQYSGVIQKFLERLRRGKEPIIFGDGRQTRDFVHANDVVAFAKLCLTSKKAVGDVFNCGSGKAESISELAKIMVELSGRNVEPRFEKQRPGEIRESCADISKASRLLGFKPKVELRDGLKGLFCQGE